MSASTIENSLRIPFTALLSNILMDLEANGFKIVKA